MSISPDVTAELAQTIIACGQEAAAALVDLLYAVADPEGDKHRHETAWIAIRAAIPFVPEFDDLCRKHCERGVPRSVEPERQATSLQ